MEEKNELYFKIKPHFDSLQIYLEGHINSELKKIQDESRDFIKKNLRIVIRDVIKNDLDINKELKKIFIDLSKSGFEPIVSKVYTTVFAKFTTRIEKTLTQKINMKTSDIRILNDDVRMCKYDMGQLKRRGLGYFNGEILPLEQIKKNKEGASNKN